MKTVREVLSDRAPVVTHQDETVHAAVRKMVEARIGALPVLDDGRLTGMFTERDLMTRVVAPGRDPASTLVKDVMTRENLVMVSPEDAYETAQRRMKRAGCRHILVVKDDRLVGVASLRDVVELGLAERTDELHMLEAYVYYFPPGLSGGA
ncbi:MAG: CBS domain-containing protein [Acidobacteriota bacterium]